MIAHFADVDARCSCSPLQICSVTFILKILDPCTSLYQNKVTELLSFAKTLVFVLVFAFVICLCLIVCRSLSAGWFHGCGPSAWNCHSFPMGSFASFRALFSLSLIFFFFYALKLFDYLDAFLWSFPGLKRTYVISEANRILEYDYEKVRLLVVNSLS